MDKDIGKQWFPIPPYNFEIGEKLELRGSSATGEPPRDSPSTDLDAQWISCNISLVPVDTRWLEYRKTSTNPGRAASLPYLDIFVVCST